MIRAKRDILKYLSSSLLAIIFRKGRNGGEIFHVRRGELTSGHQTHRGARKYVDEFSFFARARAQNLAPRHPREKVDETPAALSG